MTTTASTEDLVLRYWGSWHEGDAPDWDTFRDCLADTVDLEHGPVPADDFVAMVAAGGDPWTGVTMIESVFTDDKAALMYEGTNTATGEVIRVSEVLTVADGRIAKLRAHVPGVSFDQG